VSIRFPKVAVVRYNAEWNKSDTTWMKMKTVKKCECFLNSLVDSVTEVSTITIVVRFQENKSSNEMAVTVGDPRSRWSLIHTHGALFLGVTRSLESSMD